MTSLIEQQGYYANQQNRFSLIRQGTNVQRQRPGSLPNQQHIPRSVSQPSTYPAVQPITQTAQPAPIQKQLSNPQHPLSVKAESSNLWQQQAGILLKQYGPSLMKQFGPPVARKLGLPVAQHFGPPLAQKVGMPLARRVGLPLLRKVFLPLVKRAGFALVRRIGLPL